jgi:DNA-binding NtrC family response regulator
MRQRSESGAKKLDRAATMPVGGDTSAPVSSAYLLVFEEDSTRVVPLCARGDLVIGRGESAQVQIKDTSVSRAHARLSIEPGSARVLDLGSHNGTLVNGERVEDTRALMTGDVIVLGATTLIYHAGPTVAHNRIIDLVQFRRRAEEDLARHREFGRPFAIAAFRLEARGVAHKAEAALATVLRPTDAAAWHGSDSLLVLLAEAASAEARARTTDLLRALRQADEGARAAVQCCPTDGADIDGLVAAARAAAADAASDEVSTSRRRFRVQAGEREAIVADPAMLRVHALLERLASTDLAVLIIGETGSGKDIAAHVLHHHSARAAGRFVSLNCAALPDSAIEIELFGCVPGAFPGPAPSNGKAGLLEAAAGGTLYLDEAGDLSPTAQGKLVHVLETGLYLPVGGTEPRRLDLRIVASTHRDLESDVAAGRLRRDLYYRLKGAVVWLPPLRDRRSEILPLAETFLDEAAKRFDRKTPRLSPDAARRLTEHHWPGNVRELRSAMEFAAAVCGGELLEADLDASLAAAPPTLQSGATQTSPSDPNTAGPMSSVSAADLGDALGRTIQDARGNFRPLADEVRDLERKRMNEALAASAGNQTRAAQLIGMPLRTFVSKMRLHGIVTRAEPPASAENEPPPPPPSK